MIEIWEECSSQILVDQVWTIVKKGCLCDQEIVKILQEINREPQQDTNTISDTPNTEKEEH